MVVRSTIAMVLFAGCGFAPSGGAGDGGDRVDAAVVTVDANVDGASPTCPPEYAALEGGRYRVVRDAATWMAALADCADDGAGDGTGGSATSHTHLLVLADDDERARVVAAFPADALWIGLSDRVTTFEWLWVTGEDTGDYPPSSGPPWRPGQPTNGTGGQQDCVAIVADGWDDRLCDDGTAAYVCECDAFVQDPARI